VGGGDDPTSPKCTYDFFVCDNSKPAGVRSLDRDTQEATLSRHFRRPVPLQHALIAAGQDKPSIVVDSSGAFKEDVLKASMQTLEDEAMGLSALKQKRYRVRRLHGGDLEKVVRHCADSGQLPLIVFSFSRRECENQLLALKKLDVTSDAEKKLITEVFQGAVQTLSDADRKLPQVESLLPILRRGVGLHHSGLLPIMRELVEILFGESLVKVLFSTETFAMGVNMPAKAVIFTSLRKWDGLQYRLLHSGEYIQMSGRAGRRGKDEHGLAITLAVEKLEADLVKGVFSGASAELSSAFYLSFNMLLNLMRMEGVSPEDVIRQSFLYFQRLDLRAQLVAEKASIKAQLCDMADLRQMIEGGCKFEKSVNEVVAEYMTASRELSKLREEFREEVFVQHPEAVVPFIQPGRLVRLTHKNGQEFGEWFCPLHDHCRSSAVGLPPLAKKRKSLKPLGSLRLSFMRQKRTQSRMPMCLTGLRVDPACKFSLSLRYWLSVRSKPKYQKRETAHPMLSTAL